MFGQRIVRDSVLKAHLSTVSSLTILLLFVSFQLCGISVVEVCGLSVAPWDWTILILLLAWTGLFIHRDVYISRSFAIFFFLSLIFTIWMGISTFCSPQPLKALTMLLLQIRNLLLLLITGTLFSHFAEMETLNQRLFWIGGLIAGIAVLMYVPTWFRYPEIIANPSEWKPGVFYELDQGGVLRLIGFAGDPNFYSLWMAPAFFCGFALPLSLTRLLILSIIGISFALAMSRGFALAFIISTIFLLLARLLLKASSTKYVKRLFVCLLLIAVLVTGLRVFVIYGFWAFLSKRIELAGQTPRFAMWAHLLSGMEEHWNPFVGAGLRGAQAELGGAYSHNSFFDVLFETGLVGFLIWGFAMGYATLMALKRIRYSVWWPWIHTWFVLLIMFGGFSLVYNPFPWLLAGILVASPLQEVNIELKKTHRKH